MCDNTPDVIKRIIADRTARGLKLTFIIPDHTEPWSCFPRDEATKMKWIASGVRKGWKVLHDT